MHIFPEVNFTK